MMPETPIKTCTICQQDFPRTTEYFHRRTRTGQLHPDCRWCRNARRKRPPRVRIPSAPEGHKKCARCKEIFPATFEHFSRNKSMEDGWCWYCRCCRKADDANRKEQRRLYQQRQRQLHPERRQHTQKQWRDTHKQEVRTKARTTRLLYPERVKAWQRKYTQAHPEKVRIHHHIRRARQYALPAHYTVAMWQAACAYFHYACAICGREEGLFWRLAQDHWIPLSAVSCPGTVASNIVPLCHAKSGNHRACNSTKSNQAPLTWLTVKFGRRQARVQLKKIETFLAYMQERFPD